MGFMGNQNVADMLTGSRELDRKLAHLGSEKVSRLAITAGVGASLTAIGKAMRSAINATDASPALKRDARATIGKRFNKNRKFNSRGYKVAVVGFKVGDKAKQVTKAVAAREKRIGKSKSSGAGVGVSSANIHWFVYGTDERQQNTTGRNTGEIKDVFGRVTREALASSANQAMEAARRKIEQVITKEAKKRSL